MPSTTTETAKPQLHRSLRYATAIQPEFSGFVMAPKPRIDKIVARVLVKKANKYLMPTTSYWIHNHCSPEQELKWHQDGIFPLDLGDHKYQKAGVRSNTEYVITRFRMERTAGVAKLMELINLNNKNAHLKDMHQSMAAAIIRMYDVADEPDYHQAIIENAEQVVEVFLQVEDGHSVRTEEGLAEALPDLFAEWGLSRNSPLTLGNYMLNLWKLGETAEGILDCLNFWTENWKTVQEERAAGKAAWEALTPKRGFASKGGRIILIETDDRFLTLAARKDPAYQIRLMVSPRSGHVAISSNRADLSQVYEALNRLEPGRWYIPPGVDQMKAVLNGSGQYAGVMPTDLSTQKLVGLIQQYVEAVK